MFRRFKKNRRARAASAPVQTNSANFGLFGVYVRSLPTMGR